MADTKHESPTQRLLRELKRDLVFEGPDLCDVPRAPNYDNIHIVSVLENRELSLRARTVLALALTREDGFPFYPTLQDAFGREDRVGVSAAIAELQERGYMVHTPPNRWTFFYVPMKDAKASSTK